MQIESTNKNIYTLQLQNCNSLDDKSIKCDSSILFKEWDYKIIDILYGDEFIKSEKDLYFILIEDKINIQNAYNGFGNEICNSKLNTVNIYTDNYIEGVYFSRFFFKNVATNKIYEIDFKTVYNPYNGSNSCNFLMDLHELPPGRYYINFEYKHRTTYTNYIIEINACKKIDESQLYKD